MKDRNVRFLTDSDLRRKKPARTVKSERPDRKDDDFDTEVLGRTEKKNPVNTSG